MISGNHAVYAGRNDVHSALGQLVPEHGVVNKSRTLRKDVASVAIVRRGDPAGMQRSAGAQAGPDIPRAMSTVPPNTVCMALAHNPALFRHSPSTERRVP